MALLRQVTKTTRVLSQCQRLAVANQQRCRTYAEMTFTFASPSDIYFKESKVKQVDVPSFSGSFGILPDHVPILAVLKPGVLTVFEENSSTKYFVSSGTVTVNADSSVQILAEEAHPIDRLDTSAVRENLAKANSDLTSAQSDSAKAEAQIAVECLEALQKAMEGSSH